MTMTYYSCSSKREHRASPFKDLVFFQVPFILFNYLQIVLPTIWEKFTLGIIPTCSISTIKKIVNDALITVRVVFIFETAFCITGASLSAPNGRFRCY